MNGSIFKGSLITWTTLENYILNVFHSNLTKKKGFLVVLCNVWQTKKSVRNKNLILTLWVAVPWLDYLSFFLVKSWQTPCEISCASWWHLGEDSSCAGDLIQCLQVMWSLKTKQVWKFQIFWILDESEEVNDLSFFEFHDTVYWQLFSVLICLQKDASK